jgi:hypothetical protein
MLMDTRNHSTQLMQAIGAPGALSPETLAGFESLG